VAHFLLCRPPLGLSNSLDAKIMGALALVYQTRSSSRWLLAFSLAACSEKATTPPVTIDVAKASAVALLTPFDAAAPLERRANDSLPSSLAVQLRDSLGRAVRQAGRELRLTVLDAGGAPNAAVQLRRGGSALTDSGGVARISDLVLTGRASSGVISAQIDGLPAITLPFRLLAGALAPSASAVTVAPDSVPVGGVAQVVVLPMDIAGNKLGAGRQLTATLDGDSTLATINAFTFSAVDSSYRSSISVLGAAPSRAFRARVDGVVLSTVPLFTGTAAPPPPADPATALGVSTFPGDTTSGGIEVQSGVLLSSVTISLRSATGAVVAQAGVAVNVTATNAAGAPLSGSTLTGAGPLSTAANGTVTFPALQLTASPGFARLRFAATGLTPTGFPLRVRAGVVSGSTSTFVLTPDTVLVGGTSIATITPRDAAGSKIGGGQAVTLAQSGGSSGVTIGAVTYRASDSTYGATLTGNTAGTARTIQATVGSTSLATTRSLTVRSPSVSADITVTVNGASTFEISRFIYGGNFLDDAGSWGNTTPPAELTFNRMGGNRITAYNWENNYSNAGSDFSYQNDQFLSGSTVPGQAVRSRATPTFARGQAFMATIPMLGYVSADAAGTMTITDSDRASRLASRFRVSRASKGSAFTTTPDANDGFVYQDEFVNWFESVYPGRTTNATAPVFYSLDNEPDIWHATHKEIQSNLNDNANTERLQTYTAFSDTSAVYARAIKAVSPNAVVFGPATATYAGVAILGRITNGTIFPDPVYGSQNFFDVYLARMSAASSAAGRRLLDVLDLHFYPEATSAGFGILNDFAPQNAAMIEARVQAPRSLWDPTYRETSWVADVAGGPIRLIPRLRAQIAAHYPGTKIAITEYSYGATGQISGGVAQADALGVFGREGVFAATIWPLTNVNATQYGGSGAVAYAYSFGAFKMYRNYDGAGSSFGDTGLAATTSNIEQSSVYASRTTAGRVVLIAINKTTSAKSTRITLTSVGAVSNAQIYTMIDGSPNPTRQTDVPVSGGVLTYTMPAMSVTTLALVP
jgi:Glycoside hydrolase family 44